MEQDVDKLCAKIDELIKKLDDLDNFQAYRFATLVAVCGSRDPFLKERLAKESMQTRKMIDQQYRL